MVYALHFCRRNSFFVTCKVQGDAICIFGFDVVKASLLYYLEVTRIGFKSKHSLRGVYPQLHII